MARNRAGRFAFGTNMKNLAGKKFGRWTVILLHGKRGQHTVWYCRCVCGNEGLIYEINLKRNLGSKSCGCLKSEQTSVRMKKQGITHGHLRNGMRSRTYVSFEMMRARCLNAKATNYAEYGGRGIKICRRWMAKGKSFVNFLADMGVRPRGKTLDRIDVNKGYTPSNCRWASKTVQQRNTRRAPKYRMTVEDLQAIRRSARLFVHLHRSAQWAKPVTG
jgi:hypothetical protein